MEIGVDIIEIARIDRLLKKYPQFRTRIFTEKEISYCEQKKYPAQHYAARFAAKESIVKALGNEIENIRFRDLEIVTNPSGKPELFFLGQSRARTQPPAFKKITVSLSHSKAYAVAVALQVE